MAIFNYHNVNFFEFGILCITFIIVLKRAFVRKFHKLLNKCAYELEEYSEELQFTARVCHQLHVNIEHFSHQIKYIEADNEERYETLHQDLNQLRELLVISSERFKTLLENETSIIGITFTNDYLS